MPHHDHERGLGAPLPFGLRDGAPDRRTLWAEAPAELFRGRRVQTVLWGRDRITEGPAAECVWVSVSDVLPDGVLVGTVVGRPRFVERRRWDDPITLRTDQILDIL